MQPIISPNVRIRHREHFHVGIGSIIDDFCYFSTQVFVDCWSHIASGCSIAGGIQRRFSLGSFSSLSSGVKVWCTSDDFVKDVVSILPPGCPEIKENLISGDVAIGDYTAVGANAVIMPGNHLPEGVAVGALSFVPTDFSFKPWSVYAGVPIRLVKPRDEANVRRQVDLIKQFLSGKNV
jgi:acetyltransferase-like isoleucine patch superfamily enzyme